MKSLKITPIALVTWLMASQGYAQIAPPPDYNQKLSEVVVSATRSGTPLDQIPLNTTILTPEVLENAPDQSIDQVLKNTPSVFLNDQPYYVKDPTGQSLNVRGLGNARTLVLIDGVPALDPFYGTVQWNQVPMSSIETVEFIRGGVSSLWGNYGMGGVINIKTKNVTNSQQDVSASYGSFGTGNFAASKDVIASGSLQLRFSADYFETGGFQTQATISPATVMPNQNASLKKGQGTDASKNTNTRLQGYFKTSQDTNGFFRMAYSTMEDLSSEYAFAKNLLQQTNLAAGTTTRVDDSSNINTSVFYQNGIFNKQNGSNTGGSKAPTTPAYMNAIYSNPSTSVGGSVSYTKNMSSIIDQVLLGVDFRNIAASNTTTNLGTTSSGWPAMGSISAINYAKSQQNFYGLMGQMKSKAESFPLETTLALRLDKWTSQIPVDYNTGANGSNPAYLNVSNQQKTQLSPTLGFLYNATKDLDLRAAAYQAFHAPGMNNTLRTYGSSSSWNFANPNLTPETMTGYELGADYRWKAGFAQLTGFNNFVKDSIGTYKLQSSNSSDQALAKQLCGGSSTWTGQSTYGICNSATLNYYTNNQNLQSQGLEFQFHHDLNSHWSTDAGYTYTIARYTWSGNGDPTSNQLGGTPSNMASAGITYYPVPKASLTTTLRYIGNSWQDVSHTMPIPAYAVVGLRGNYQVMPQASIYASIVNLFNRQYVTFASGTSVNNYQAGMPQAITVGARIIF